MEGCRNAVTNNQELLATDLTAEKAFERCITLESSSFSYRDVEGGNGGEGKSVEEGWEGICIL